MKKESKDFGKASFLVMGSAILFLVLIKFNKGHDRSYLAINTVNQIELKLAGGL